MNITITIDMSSNNTSVHAFMWRYHLTVESTLT